MGKIGLMAGIIVIVVILAAVGYYFMSGSDNPEDGLSATINGSDLTYAEMTEKFGTKVVNGKEGVPLGALVNDTALVNPGTYAFVLEATDGYAMAVNWTALQTGMLTLQNETEDGTVTYFLRLYFPDLPSAYNVGSAGKDFSKLTPAAGLSPVVCNGMEFYLDYMPKRVCEKTIAYNDTYSPTGWSLSDIVNFTGLANPESHEYTVVGYDATDDEPWYNKTVTWDGMLQGVLVDDEVRVRFADSTMYATGRYSVSHVIEIVVE